MNKYTYLINDNIISITDTFSKENVTINVQEIYDHAQKNYELQVIKDCLLHIKGQLEALQKELEKMKD